MREFWLKQHRVKVQKGIAFKSYEKIHRDSVSEIFPRRNESNIVEPRYLSGADTVAWQLKKIDNCVLKLHRA